MSNRVKKPIQSWASSNGAAESTASARDDPAHGEEQEEGQLPLLDEVSNLLQKERTLMGLRVLEKEAEAIDWRTKYETLVSKLSDGSAEGATPVGDAARGLEMAAEIDAASGAPVSIPDFRARVMQALREDKESTLDLSNTNVGVHGISEVLKILRAMKKKTALRCACLKNTNLDASCSEQVAALFGFPFLEGIDLSYNSLGRNFLSSLITTLQLRRKSPQYIMLNCNPELSDQSLAPMLPHLSSDTWGLVISADDGPSGVLGAQQTPSMKSKTPPPQRCAYEFLRTLNARMASLSQHEAFEDTEEPKKKTRGGNREEETASVGFRRGGISSLSVLGIVHSTISKLSLRLLEETLELTAASLTDLDLSFCMLGYRGVDMLQRALCKPSSQVIRLGLRGNCITDSAVPLLGRIIESSRTLIYIDLGANMITGEGLAQLTKYIKKNVILYSIRLCGNPMGVHSVAQSQEALERSGCMVNLRFTDAITAGSTRQAGLSSYRDGALYYSAKIVTTTLQTEPKVIFKIPVKSIQIKEAIRFDATGEDGGEIVISEAPKRSDHIGSLLLRWKMKVRTLDAVVNMEKEPSAFKATDTNAFAPLEWEIFHCSGHDKRTVYCSTDFGRPPFVPGHEQWSICEAVIPQVPLVGYIEVAIRRITSPEANPASGSIDAEESRKSKKEKYSSSSVGKATITAPSIYVDAYDLCATVHDNPLHPTPGSAGCDVSIWNGITNQAVSTAASAIATLPYSHVMESMKRSMLYSGQSDAMPLTRKSDAFPLPDHTIIRLLSWPGPSVNDAKLSFSMKLTNVASGASTYDGGLGRVKSAHFGYEWAVTVYRIHGVLERPVRASVLPHSETLIPQDSAQLVSYKDSGSYSSVSLMPWSWRTWTVTLNMVLRPGDRVLLTARVLAEGTSSSIPNGVAVVCQSASFDFMRTTANGDWLVQGTEESALFAVHNDPGLFISL